MKTDICPEWFDNQRGKLRNKIYDIFNRNRNNQKIDGYSYPEFRRMSFVGGDPWLIEGVTPVCFNLGVSEEEEFFELTDRFGRKGLVYDFNGLLEIA